MPPPYEQHNQPLNVHSTDRDNPHRFQPPAHQYSMQPSPEEHSSPSNGSSGSEVLIQISLLVVVVNGDRSRVDDFARLAKSFFGHIFLSCLVLWFCVIIRGFKAFILARMYIYTICHDNWIGGLSSQGLLFWGDSSYRAFIPRDSSHVVMIPWGIHSYRVSL